MWESAQNRRRVFWETSDRPANRARKPPLSSSHTAQLIPSRTSRRACLLASAILPTSCKRTSSTRLTPANSVSALRTTR